MKRTAALLLIHTILFLASSVVAAPVRLAIGTLGLSPESLDVSLADLVAAQLSGTPEMDLVERRELDAVLKEASLSLAGLVRAKDAVRFGGLLRADQFLLGSSISINKTNRLVIRLVDARTGVIQAITVLLDTGSLETLAEDIVRFARGQSQRAPKNARDFLAIGVVQNLGVNNRFSDFPAQMRGSVAAGLGGKMTVLERDVVAFLANEVRLDMAGLTERQGQQQEQMQFGFWIVDGFYQSYEVAEPEVQLRLRVERVSGGQQSVMLQGKPDEQFFNKICEIVQKAASQPVENAQAVPATRQGEIEALEARGSQLIDYLKDIVTTISGPEFFFKTIELRTAKTKEKQLSALDEATRVYESILLLDHENNAAKMRLAGCLLFHHWDDIDRKDRKQREERAKDCYREVIASQDPKYAEDARINLAYACFGFEGVDMLRRFANETAKAKARFRRHQKELLLYLEYHSPIEATLPHLRAQLFDELSELKMSTNNEAVVNFDEVLFAWRFKPDQRAEIANVLLPDLVAKFPDMQPHILLAAVGEQTATNSPIITQFLASLKSCEENPEAMWRPTNYFTHLSTTAEDEKAAGSGWLYAKVYDRAFEYRQYALVVTLAEARQRAAQKEFAPPLTEHGKRLLAESYMALKQWKPALELFNGLAGVPVQLVNTCRTQLGGSSVSEAVPDSAWKDQPDLTKVVIAYESIERHQWSTAVSILESIGRRTVRMNRGGPWGYAFTPVLPSIVADECRTKAGMPAIKDPARFEIGDTPYISFSPNGVRMFSIEPEADDLWMAMYSHIKLFRGDGPFAAGSPSEFHEFDRATKGGNTCMCMNPDYIWAGTYDDGLMELNRKTGERRRFTVNDGLMLNAISGLALQAQTLWITYRNGANGAVGILDLKSHKFSTMTPSLAPSAGANSEPWHNQKVLDDPHQAPQLPIRSMTGAAPDEMWFAVDEKGVQKFRASTGVWDTIQQLPIYKAYYQAMASDPTQSLLLLAQREHDVLSGARSASGGLIIYNYQHNKFEALRIHHGLPSNDLTAIAADGRIVWVGGRGFIAIVDSQTRNVLRYAYVSSSRIHQIRLGRTYAWVAISCEKNGYPDAGNALSGVYRLRRSVIEPAEYAANRK